MNHTLFSEYRVFFSQEIIGRLGPCVHAIGQGGFAGKSPVAGHLSEVPFLPLTIEDPQRQWTDSLNYVRYQASV
jgi:hypothetical protein